MELFNIVEIDGTTVSGGELYTHARVVSREGQLYERDRNDLTNWNNPETFMPRGNMYDVNTRRAYNSVTHESVNLCFSLDDDEVGYPNSAAGYPNGFNLVDMNTTVSGMHGVYIAPPPNKVIYITELVFTIEYVNRVDISQPIDKNGQTIRLYHNNIPYCSISSMVDMFTMASEVRELSSVFNPGLSTYSIKIPVIPAGRFEGKPLGETGVNQYFRLATSNGVGLDSNYITEFYSSFKMWILDLDKE